MTINEAVKTISAKPILFSTSMVRVILEGRKSVTRRVIKPQPVIDAEHMWLWKDCQWIDGGIGFPKSGIDDYAPYGFGKTLWDSLCRKKDLNLYGWGANPWVWVIEFERVEPT